MSERKINVIFILIGLFNIAVIGYFLFKYSFVGD